LCGHCKGAFTDSICDEKGWFGQAENSTLVIQELGEMHPEHQALFLTVLEERTYRRIGDNKEFPLTAQIIMTTDKDLKQAAEHGLFSQQLLHRIKRQIKIPPLRERPEDIPVIIEGWRRERQVTIGHVDDAAIRALRRFSWPGNVRQLLSVMQTVAESGNWSVANIRATAEAIHEQSPQLVDAGSSGAAPDDEDVNKLRQAILDALADGVSLSRDDLQQRTSCKVKSTMVSSLNSLVQSGRVKRLGKGPRTCYRLNGNGR
jgi:DNA-binding NtrC family response regulator